MSLVRYEPFNLLNRLGVSDPFAVDAFANKLSEDVTGNNWRPAVDIKEEDNSYVINADLPGIDPKDIEVTMEDGVLTIKGERESEKEETGTSYKRVERTYGSFYRRFSLPDTADSENIKANGKNGVLEVVIPKQKKVLARKISVNH
jgi:HSP20 family protein